MEVIKQGQHFMEKTKYFKRMLHSKLNPTSKKGSDSTNNNKNKLEQLPSIIVSSVNNSSRGVDEKGGQSNSSESQYMKKRKGNNLVLFQITHKSKFSGYSQKVIKKPISVDNSDSKSIGSPLNKSKIQKEGKLRKIIKVPPNKKTPSVDSPSHLGSIQGDLILAKAGKFKDIDHRGKKPTFGDVPVSRIESENHPSSDELLESQDSALNNTQEIRMDRLEVRHPLSRQQSIENMKKQINRLSSKNSKRSRQSSFKTYSEERSAFIQLDIFESTKGKKKDKKRAPASESNSQSGSKNNSSTSTKKPAYFERNYYLEGMNHKGRPRGYLERDSVFNSRDVQIPKAKYALDISENLSLEISKPSIANLKNRKMY